MVNHALMGNIILRTELACRIIGSWLGARISGAESAFKRAAFSGVILTLVGYVIAYVGFNFFKEPAYGVIDFGVGVMAFAGLVSAIFLMITLAQLGAAGLAAAGLLGVAEQISRPIPGPTFNFSEVWDTARGDKLLRQVTAVFTAVMFVNVYAMIVPVYASLSRFLVVSSLALFVAFVAYSFDAASVWLPRLQRLSMFVAAGMIVIFTAQLFALSAGTTLSSIFNPFGMKYDSSASKEGANNLAPEVASWASKLSEQTGMSETAAYTLFTLGWVVVILLFIGIVIPWLLRATGIIEKPLRAESAAPTASKSTGWSASTIVKVVVGLVLVFIAGSWVLAGMAWMIENARPENNQDTRGSVTEPAKEATKTEIPPSVKVGELPVRWQTVSSVSLKPDSDWQEAGVLLEPNDCVSFELAGWSGSILVEVGEDHGQLEAKSGEKITPIHKGELKMKIFSITSDRNAPCSVIVRKRVVG